MPKREKYYAVSARVFHRGVPARMYFKTHTNRDSAANDARRLANENPGTTVYVLETIEGYVVEQPTPQAVTLV